MPRTSPHATELAQELFASVQWNRRDWKKAKGPGHGLQLRYVSPAMPAHREMELERESARKRESPLEKVGHELGHFVASQHHRFFRP